MISALKYTIKGNVTLKVELAKTGDYNILGITMSDTGVGVPA